MTTTNPPSFADHAAECQVRIAVPPNPSDGAAYGPLAAWAGPMLCAFAFLWMVVLGWRKWADPLVDFGRELYIPWRIMEGDVLYRDVAAIFGPFSQYFNALMFRLFGVSITTLIFCNLAILAGLIVLIYRLFADACDRLTATAACLLLILVFGFSQYGGTANYNFVCPYAHEATHGVVLSVAMLFCLARQPRRPRVMAALAGLCFGLVLLTKAEIAVAAGLVLIAWLGLGLTLCRATMRLNARCVLILLTASLAPFLLFLTYFSTQMPAPQAIDGLLRMWTSLTVPGIADNPFYERCMGIDDLRASAFAMLKAFAAIAGGGLAIALLELAVRGRRTLQADLGLAVGAAIVIVAMMRIDSLIRLDLSRAIPLVAMTGWLVGTLAVLKCRGSREELLKILPLWLWASFSLALLVKIVLQVQFFHYGFYLAMPAAVTFAVLVLWQVPNLLGGGKPRSLTFRGAALGALAAVIAPHLWVSQEAYSLKTMPLGRGADSFWTFTAEQHPVGLPFVRALDFIQNRMPTDATVVVMPEGVMLNYLSRRVNPTPYTNFMIVEMLIFGEDNILASFKRHSPDYVVLAHKDVAEYGLPPFGSDARYGKAIMDWVRAEYEPVELIGAEPFKDPRRFGIKILRHRTPASRAAWP